MLFFPFFLPPSCRAMWTVISVFLALSSGALSLEKLNMCMDAKHHKTEPGPEGELYLQVMNINVPHQRQNRSNSGKLVQKDNFTTADPDI